MEDLLILFIHNILYIFSVIPQCIFALRDSIVCVLFVCFVNRFGSARWRFAPQIKPPPETEVWPNCSHEFLINKNNFILPHIAPSS